MSDESTELIVKGLETEPVRNLLGPVTKEVGGALGDVAALVRFYLNDNLSKVFTKWARQRNDRPLNASEFKNAIPLLQAASMQSDDELQERWAALLESSVANPDSTLPSFGQTLSQLSSEEARFLDRLWAFASQPLPYVSERAFGREPFDYYKLVEVYDPHLRSVNHAERIIFKDKLTAAQLEDYDRFVHAELVVQDLERLGIITHEQKAEPPNSTILGLGTSVKLHAEYSFTQYGVNFVRAVTPSKE